MHSTCCTSFHDEACWRWHAMLQMAKANAKEEHVARELAQPRHVPLEGLHLLSQQLLLHAHEQCRASVVAGVLQRLRHVALPGHHSGCAVTGEVVRVAQAGRETDWGHA